MMDRNNLYRTLSRCLLVTLGILAGCNALRIPWGINVDPSDWPMDGRTAARSGVAGTWVLPPLTPAWNVDLGSGAGQGSPLIVDSFVVVGTLRGEVLVFHARTGRRLGGASFGDAVTGSPALQGNVAYIPVANSAESMIAYDLEQGKVLWKRSCGNIEASPLLSNGRLYAGTTEGALVCLDTAAGGILWRFELPANRTGKGIRSAPASGESLVVFGADDGSVYALDAITGALRWRCQTGAAVMAGPALSEQLAAVGNVDGEMFGIAIADGSVRWKRRIGAPIRAGAVMVDGMVIVGTTGGTVYAVRETDGSVLWECPVEGAVSTSGAVSGAFLYVGTLRKNLLAIRLADGKVIWKDSLDGRVKSAPAVGRDRLVVVTDDRLLRAYAGGTP